MTIDDPNQQPILSPTPATGAPADLPPGLPPHVADPFQPPAAELAGFWSRVGARLLDGVLYGLVFAPFAIGGAVMMVTQTNCNDAAAETFEVTGNVGVFALGGFLIAAGVLVTFGLYLHALATSGQPWGKRIVGLRVVDGSGRPIGWGRALLRMLAESAASSQSCMIGFLWMLGNRERQTWHDKIARSFVIRDPS